MTCPDADAKDCYKSSPSFVANTSYGTWSESRTNFLLDRLGRSTLAGKGPTESRIDFLLKGECMPHHQDLHPFPTTAPPGIVRVVIDALRGKVSDPREAAHMVWHLTGFALSKWDTHLIGQGSCQPLHRVKSLTWNQAADQLEQLYLPKAGQPQTADCDWGCILQCLLALWRELMS